MTDDDPYKPPDSRVRDVSTRLEPLKVIGAAVMHVSANWRVYLQALLLPAAVMLAVSIAISMSGEPTTSWLILIPAMLATHTVFAVMTIRLTVLGSSVVQGWTNFSWTRRETLFFGRSLLIALIMIPIGLLAAIPVLGIPLAFVLIVWVMSRLSLLLTASALDHETSISTAWELSEKHQLPLVGIATIFPVIMALPAIAFSFAPAVLTPIGDVIGVVTTAFTQAAVGLAYREILRLDNVTPIPTDDA